MIADAAIRWTARLFVACYVGRICFDAAGRRDATSQRIARWLWTAGCAVYLIHSALAFHFVHGWRHNAAFEHVAKRSFETMGIASGVGLYINYSFGLLWLVDTFLWWRRLDWAERRVPYWGVQGFFAFLMSQATVVFGPPHWIPVSAGILLLLITLRVRGYRYVKTAKSGLAPEQSASP